MPRTRHVHISLCCVWSQLRFMNHLAYISLISDISVRRQLKDAVGSRMEALVTPTWSDAVCTCSRHGQSFAS